MTSGTVKSWDDSKGYGFISIDSGVVFVHYTAIESSLKSLFEGQLVSISFYETPRGLCAKLVRADEITN